MSAASESVPNNLDKPKLFMIDVQGQGIWLVPEMALKEYPVCATVQDLIQNAIRTGRQLAKVRHRLGRDGLSSHVSFDSKQCQGRDRVGQQVDLIEVTRARSPFV